jgi:flagellar motor switch protein FliN/FliY
MSAEEASNPSEQDDMADAWAAALAESKGAGAVASEVSAAPEQVAPAAFTNFTPSTAGPAPATTST